jgi:hypothetical protein
MCSAAFFPFPHNCYPGNIVGEQSTPYSVSLAAFDPETLTVAFR